MSQKITKIIAILVVVALLIAGGVLLLLNLGKNNVVGKIEFGKDYYLAELHPGVFENVTINNSSYIKLNDDKKTGELNIIGLAEVKIEFILTKYTETTQGTKFNIEYIYKNELRRLEGISSNTEITFRSLQPYRVDITQENPGNIEFIEYESTIMVFSRGTNI